LKIKRIKNNMCIGIILRRIIAFVRGKGEDGISPTRYAASAILGLLVWVSAAGAAGAPPLLLQGTPAAQPLTPYQVIDMVNGVRTAKGLKALIVDPILMGTAQTTADLMAGSQMTGHLGGVRERVMAAGYGVGDIPWATENFVVLPLSGDQADILQAWADDEHMIPMANPNYKHVGAGVAETGDGYVYYVLHAAYTSDGKYKPGQTPGPGTPTVDIMSQYIYAVQTTTPQPDGRLFHVVKPGQSLWSIAIAYHTHIDALQRLNGFDADNQTVYTGQKLLIAVGATLPPTYTPSPEATQGVMTTDIVSGLLETLTLAATRTPPKIITTPAAGDGSTATGAHSMGFYIMVVLLAGIFLVAMSAILKK
jgi:LysM repeat protein